MPIICSARGTVSMRQQQQQQQQQQPYLKGGCQSAPCCASLCQADLGHLHLMMRIVIDQQAISCWAGPSWSQVHA